MNLSKRERNIALVAGAIVVLLALDHFVISPFFNSRADMATQRQLLEAQLSEARLTISASQAARRRWTLYKTAGGLQINASDTENNLLNKIRQWSQKARLTLISLRPDRASSDQGVQEMTFQASAQGTLQAISAFVYEVETAQLPVRIREIQLATRTENKDDLTMQMRISTLWDDVASRQTAANTAAGRTGSTTH